MGGVVALVAVLVVLLRAVRPASSTTASPACEPHARDRLRLRRGHGTDAAFTRSVIETDQVGTIAEQPGVLEGRLRPAAGEARTREDGSPVDLTLVGIDHSFVAPAAIAEGNAVGAADGIGTCLSATAAEDGLAVGDTVALARGAHAHRGAAVLEDQHTFGHVDIAYLPLGTWQELLADPGGRRDPTCRTSGTAVALRTDRWVRPAEKRERGVGHGHAHAHRVFDASPVHGPSRDPPAQVFLYAISALVAWAFFTVWVISAGTRWP